jgi:hypothetical protein
VRNREKLSEHEAGLRRIISTYRARAKKRGLSWALTEFEAAILLTSSCFYCGSGPTRSYNRHGLTTDSGYGDLFEANGIDRMDPAQGYEKSNCVSACARCNYGKHTETFDGFIQWISTVYQHLSAQGLLT